MRFLLIPLLCLVGLPVQARTFCCDVGNRTYCDEGVPPACYGKAYRELGKRGETVRYYEAPLTPEQKAQRDAELAKKKEEEARALEEDRRNRKLLGTYPTVKELDDSHARVLADLEKGLKQAQEKLAESQGRRNKLDEEAEFYKKRSMPESLKLQVRRSDTEIKSNEKNVNDRLQDIETAKQRFAEERTRYLELINKPAMAR